MRHKNSGDPKWLGWVIYPFVIGFVHLFVLVVLSLFFAYSAPWLLYPLALPAMIAEDSLSATSGYKGQDSLQWPIIVVNSALYGFAIYGVYRRFLRSIPVA